MRVSQLTHLGAVAALVGAAACGGSTPPASQPTPAVMQAGDVAPHIDARSNLKAGLMDAGEASFGLKIDAKAVSPPGFLGQTNSDLAFVGKYAIQGNYNGPVIWDMSDPTHPAVVTAYQCPASQNDISVYKNLMFMSAEAFNGRVDCKPSGQFNPADSVSKDRMRGVRVFDISDIKNPKLVANVQTCRGSHTHTLLEDPKDRDNVYVYVSGSAPIRSGSELPGCTADTVRTSSATSLMRIEVIKVPLAHPEQAAVVNRANIFGDLKAAPTHGLSAADKTAQQRAVDSVRAHGNGFIAVNPQTKLEFAVNPFFIRGQLDSIVKARGGTPAAQGSPSNATSADTAALRAGLQTIINRVAAPNPNAPVAGQSAESAFRQCHDITVYPALGLAGGACEGHGFLLDVSNPTAPVRVDAVADSNFSYWHSATFNNDGTKILFSDEWGGGGAPKCRAGDPKEFGADAIFTIEDRKLKFQSYYKLPSIQTDKENCVAHNGSLIPIPGRDVMIQAWYQGGISVFDFTDAKHPKEIAYFDRGPIDSTRFSMGGSWSAYWYNGSIISSEIARGLDVAELVPTEYLTQNEIDAAKTVHWDQLNVQGQPKIAWPPSFPLAKAYVDQLERNKCLSGSRVASVRQSIAQAEGESGAQRRDALTRLASSLDADKGSSCDAPRIGMLQKALREIPGGIIP
jgi:LVIVD repeat